jgi:hypothetical protein
LPAWARVASPLLVAAVLSPVAISFWRTAAPVRAHVEYAGIIPRLEQLAASIDPRDLLIVESRNAGSDLHTLALPLADIYARNVLVLDSPVPPKRQFETFVAWAAEHYRRVLFLGGGGTDLLMPRVAATPLMNDRISVPEYDAPVNAFPSGVRRKDFELGLYQLTPVQPSAVGPIDLQIGGPDDLNVLRFFAREKRTDTGLAFRWTGGQSFVVLPGIRPEAREIILWLSSGGRPPSAPPPHLEVALGNDVLGSVTPDDQVKPYTLPIPLDLVQRAAAGGDPVRLRLRVSTWNPKTLLGANDSRDLGVIVTRVQVP